MLRQSVMFGPQWFPNSGTPTPVPIDPTMLFDSTGANYGLGGNDAALSGATNAYGAGNALGTATTSALDGALIYLGNVGRPGKFNLRLDSDAPFATDIPFRDGNGVLRRIDHPIRAGAVLNIELATTSGAQSFRAHAAAFKSAPACTGTGIAVLGSAANLNAMGVTLSVPNQWELVGALPADCQALQTIDIGNANGHSHPGPLHLRHRARRCRRFCADTYSHDARGQRHERQYRQLASTGSAEHDRAFDRQEGLCPRRRFRLRGRHARRSIQSAGRGPQGGGILIAGPAISWARGSG